MWRSLACHALSTDASIAHTLQQYLPRGGLYLQAATTMEVDADDDYDYGYISYWGGAGGGYYGGTGVSGAGPSSQRAKPAAPRQALVNPHMNVTLAPEVVDRRLDQLFDREWLGVRVGRGFVQEVCS
jgi:hypothetical protein